MQLGRMASEVSGTHHEAERTTRQQKWLRPYRDLFSLYLYHVGHFNEGFKRFYTLDYISTLCRSPTNACRSCCACNTM